MAADPGAYDVVVPVEHPPAAGHDIGPVMAAGPSDEPALATPELEAPARPLPPAPFAYGTAARSRPGTRWGLTGLVAAAGLALGVVSGAGIARLWTGGADAETGDAAAGAPAAGRGDVSLARESSDRESDRPDAEPRAALDARRALAPAGRLVVRSQPSGALVTVDGRLLGETPMARDLPLGTHAVRVAHPGHVPRTERVTLAAATPMRTLSVTLQPGLAPVAATRGAIDVDSRPRGARVSVDGRFIGLAPLRVADLAAGEHQVALDLGGYEPATSRVQVEPGRAASVRLTLRATH
jgi:hypothetical protein